MKINNKLVSITITALLYAGLSSTAIAAGTKITPSIESVTVEHNGNEVAVSRNQDPNGVADVTWTKTGRRCPPFCVQPLTAAPGVETVGIAEVVNFMRNELVVDDGVIIDARIPDWFTRGTIPGSVNIPFTSLHRSKGADDGSIMEAFERFGVTRSGDGSWDFSEAKNLILWCNGWWCGQSPMAIKGLLNEGYPADRLFYYRGGMQNWQIYGLTVVK